MTTTHGLELKGWANKKIAALEEELTRYKCDHQLLLEERDALFAERRDLRTALEAVESERDRFRAGLSTPEWDNNGNCQLCANRFAYVHSLGCPRQRH